MPLERFEKNKSKRLNLKTTESIASSLASNLNKATGPTDLKKMLLGDDYFSDVNPRSMRRLMNIIHITGRLLKAFNIDFNWYHLSTFVNVTEQWPYRLSWMILYCEQFQKDLDDSLSLKSICERVKPFVPTSKEMDPNVALDRDLLKLDVYLGLHKSSLLVSTMYIFLPFTINLDPQLRKDITELYQPLDQFFKQGTGNVASLGNVPAPPSPYLQPHFAHNLRFRNSGRGAPALNGGLAPFYGFPQVTGPGQMSMPMWAYPPINQPLDHPTINDPVLMKQLRNKRLSMLSVDGLCELVGSLPILKNSNVTHYQSMFRQNNICGRVLLRCDLNELKQVLQMSFGDWELFKSVVVTLREIDRVAETSGLSMNSQVTGTGDVRINITGSDRMDSGSKTVEGEKKHLLRPNVLEKQVTMEEQMICGALELLNDDAKEDARKGEESSTSTLSPINSEAEVHFRASRKNSKLPIEQHETDVLYVTGTSLNLTAELPDSPSILRKLESAKFSISNENQSRSPTFARSDAIGVPGKDSRVSQSSLSKSLESPGKRGKGIPRNVSSASITSQLRRDGSMKEKGILKSPGMFESRKGSRKISKAAQKETSSDTSSDESQKALISRISGATSHARKPSVKTTRGSEHEVAHPLSPKKRVGRDDFSRFSKLKSTFLSGISRDERSGNQTSESSSSYFTKGLKHETDESEPAVYFREPASASRHQGQPWTQFRAPTPMPVFGSEEYYKVIKSNNPSPTTSNESELGSTPEELSSGENLFLPGPPDLPESPFPRRNVGGRMQPAVPIPQLAQLGSMYTPQGFVPFQSLADLGAENASTPPLPPQENERNQMPSHSRRPPVPRKIHGKTVSSGEENSIHHHRPKSHIHAVNSAPLREEKIQALRAQLVAGSGSGQLLKTPLMQSDPVLFNSEDLDIELDHLNPNQQREHDSHDGLTLSQIRDEINAQCELRRRESKDKGDNKATDDSGSNPTSPLLRQAALDMSISDS